MSRRRNPVYCECGHAKTAHTKTGCRHEYPYYVKGSPVTGRKRCACPGFREKPKPEIKIRGPATKPNMALLDDREPTVSLKTSWDDPLCTFVQVSVAFYGKDAKAEARAFAERINGGPIDE